MEPRMLMITLREQRGWNQNELATKLNTTQQYISLIENGRRNPSIRMVKRLEMLFGVPMEELFPDIFAGI